MSDATHPEADLYVVGLGVLNVDDVTRGTERVLRSCNEVLFVDTGIATRDYLATLCERVTPLFEESYREAGRRLDAYDVMAARVIEAALDHPPVAFAMVGHPTVGAYAPFLIRDMAQSLDLRVKVLPGISALDALCADLMLDPCVDGLQTYEATDVLLRRRPLRPDVPAVIWQVGTLETRLHSERVSRPGRFVRFRDHLLRFYPPTHPVTAVYASPHPLLPTAKHTFPLGEICEHADALHPGVSLVVPPVGRRPLQDAALARDVDSVEHLRRITR
jgi:hypothetical protein